MNRILLIILFISSSYARVTGKSESEIIEKAKKATLKIKVIDEETGSTHFGTAFFIEAEGGLLTNSHNIWQVLSEKSSKRKIIISNSDGKSFKDVNVIKCSDPDELDLCFLQIKNHRPKHFFEKSNNFKLGKGNRIQHIGHCQQDFSVKSGKLKDSVKVLKEYYSSLLGNHAAHVFDGDYGACGGDSGAAVFYIDGISFKKAILIGVITGGKTGETWTGSDYAEEFKYKYAIDIDEVENLKKVKGIARDISSLTIEEKDGIDVKLDDARKNRDIKTYLKTLYGK